MTTLSQHGIKLAGLLSYCLCAAAETKLYTLDQVMELAVSNNPELQIMQERIGQADAQFGQAVSSFYPQIKIGLSFLYSNNPAQAFSMLIAERRLNFGGTDFNHPGFVEDYRPQVTASYSLFRGGQDYYLSQAVKLGIDATELEKDATRNRLLSSVAAAYYGELAAGAAHQVSLSVLNTVDSELKQSQTRMAAGAELKSDVLSIEAQLADAKQAEIQTANAIELARAMLKTLLGLEIGEELAIADQQPLPTPARPAAFNELLNQALGQHPELKAAEKKLAAAEQQLNAAQAAYLPRADAYVSYGSDSKNLTYSSSRDNLTAGVMVELDLFNGFATQEKINKAEHEVNAAREQTRQIRLAIENQLKTAQLKLQEALGRIEAGAAAVAAAAEALRLVEEQRHAGAASVTRYLEAQTAHERMQNRLINARYDALRAEAELKQACGHWQ